MGSRRSKNQGSVEIKRRLCTDMLYFALPFQSEVIEAETVDFWIHQVDESLLDLDPARRLYLKLEYRELDTLAIVPTQLGNAP